MNQADTRRIALETTATPATDYKSTTRPSFWILFKSKSPF